MIRLKLVSLLKDFENDFLDCVGNFSFVYPSCRGYAHVSSFKKMKKKEKENKKEKNKIDVYRLVAQIVFHLEKKYIYIERQPRKDPGGYFT